MNRIRNTFNRGKVLLSFLMGGDPWPEATESFGMAMLDAGSDILILGIPFSDPIEDAAGQNAHLRALASGVTTAGILRMARRLRADTGQPLLLRAYLNSLFRYGYESFFAACKEAGVDGLIIPDLPAEEKDEILPFAGTHDMTLIPQIAPTSGDRISKLLDGARDFVHVLASPEPAQTSRLAKEAADLSGLPVVLDLPFVDRKQVNLLFEAADGILWSGSLDLIKRYGRQATRPILQDLTVIRQAAGR